ncbi:MAG: uroporphyrinogen decarboxylase family protein [Candidatus Latescibacterota bacterium]
MTPRERILAVVCGEEPPDQVPFVQYDGLAAPNEEVWEAIGAGEMGVLRWTRLHRLEYPHCTTHTQEVWDGQTRGTRTVIETPRGPLTEVRFYEPTYGSGSIRKHFVTAPEDYDRLLACFEDGVVVEDLEAFHRTCVALGEQGMPLVAVERTPYQQMWVQWVGIQDLAWHLADCPERVDACMQALARQERAIFDIAVRAPIDFVDFPDNITAPVIGPANFRRYCLPLYQELSERMGSRPVFVHMDGDLKPLYQAIGESGVRGLDSLSPPPDNDTSVGEALCRWPEMRVWVNFPSSVHLQDEQGIHERAAEILAQGAATGRLQIQISENVPPGVWRRSFPQIVRAIREATR